jgi:dolichol kinase
MERETKRKVIHISMGFLTLLLSIFPRWLAIIFVLVALFFVLVIARPSVWKRGFDAMASREEDQDSGLLHGPVLYVFMVLLLVIFLDLRIAATVFAIMAFGDGLANVIGSRYGHSIEKLQNKSIEGFFAFLFFAFISGTIVFFLVSFNQFQNIKPWLEFLTIPEKINEIYVVFCCFLVSVIGALTELLTSRLINDNISVPVICGALLTVLLMF